MHLTFGNYDALVGATNGKETSLPLHGLVFGLRHLFKQQIERSSMPCCHCCIRLDVLLAHQQVGS